MNLALEEAKTAFLNQEVPVGAILVRENKIISRSYNQSISKKDPSGHAEMNVLRDAAKKMNNYRRLFSSNNLYGITIFRGNNFKSIIITKKS